MQMLRPALLSRRLGHVVLWVGLLAPVASHGYATQIHTELSRRSLAKSGLGDPAATINPAAFESLRTTIDTYARGEATLREAWTKRYPTAAAFDVFAEKQLFQFAPSSKVFGIEAVDERIKPGATLLELLAIGSAQPDDDWRNRERLAYDDKRQPLKEIGRASCRERV